MESPTAQRLPGDLRTVRGRHAFRGSCGGAERRREEDGDAKGRPVGVAIDGTGALLAADDVGNTIWSVSAAP